MYIPEIAPSKQRGMVGSIIQLFLVLGILAVYTLSSFSTVRYYHTSLVLVGFILLFTGSMIFFPETPRWLLAHGQKKRAVAVLKFLRGPKYNFKDELETIQANIKQKKQLGAKKLLKEFSKCEILIPQCLVACLAMFRICGGLDAVNAFSATILRDAGVEKFREVSIYGTACARLVTNLIVVFIADLIGRKVLLVVSGIVAFIGTLMLGVHFYITQPSMCELVSPANNVTEASGDGLMLCNTHLAPLAIVALVVYNVGYSIGWGPILWVLVGELLPLRIRGIGTGIGTVVTWGLAAVVVGSYLSYSNAVQLYGVWWTYAAVNLASVFFVLFCIYETRGKSLEDIQLRYERKFGTRTILCTS